MLKPRTILIILTATFLIFVAGSAPNPTYAYYTNMPASVVLGQSDFSSSGSGVSATALNNPRGVATDGRHLFVADRSNNRVLIWNTIPTANNTPADVVIGQTNFTNNSGNQGGAANAKTLSSPTRVASDGTRLYVADTSNNRVLIFNSIPVTNNASADVVVGQPNFSSNSCVTSQTTLCFPEGLFFDGHRLYVSDPGSVPANHRIMIWNSLPTTNGIAADVVVGQSSFTANSSGTSANTLTSPRAVWVDHNRLFVVDTSNSRVLVYNSIPASNDSSADIAVGEPDFTTASSPVSPTSLSSPNSAIIMNDKLIVADSGFNRVLIFNNILSTPGMSTSGIDNLSEGKLRISGNVLLGERGKYALQRVQASVNGQGWSDVTFLRGGTDDGTTTTRYEFYHEFEPWAGIGSRDTYDPSSGYTVKLSASSYNAEDDNLFYFQPFNLNSVTGSALPVVSFTVNKAQWQRLKDNLDSFEVQAKKEGSDQWMVYADPIPVSDETFAANTGKVSLSVRPRAGISLTAGKYQVKVFAKDNWGHHQETNALETTLSGLSGSAYNPLNLAITSQWFPLQVNKISGVRTGILASFNLASVSGSYTAATATPTFEGVAFSGSTVAIQVTDTKTGKTRLFTTKAIDSMWKLTPMLYSSSQVDISVYDDAGRYNELLPLSIKVAQPVQTPAPEQ